jgi:hypothetical protein
MLKAFSKESFLYGSSFLTSFFVSNVYVGFAGCGFGCSIFDLGYAGAGCLS